MSDAVDRPTNAGPTGSALPVSARNAFVRRRRFVWGMLALLVAGLIVAAALVALHLARWERIGVETVADIVRMSDCRVVDDGARVCRFAVEFRTRDGRDVSATLLRNTTSATYADASRRALRIRYDPNDPNRISTDFTDPAGPMVIAVAISPFLVICIRRAATGRRWLDRLDRLASDPSAPRRRMDLVLLTSSSSGMFAAPWAWIVDPGSVETRGLNVPLIKGQELVVPGSVTEVEVIGSPRPRGMVMLVVDGVLVYPKARARRYGSTRRVQWEPVEATF